MIELRNTDPLIVIRYSYRGTMRIVKDKFFPAPVAKLRKFFKILTGDFAHEEEILRDLENYLEYQIELSKNMIPDLEIAYSEAVESEYVLSLDPASHKRPRPGEYNSEERQRYLNARQATRDAKSRIRQNEIALKRYAENLKLVRERIKEARF